MNGSRSRQIIERVFKKCLESVNPRSTIAQAISFSPSGSSLSVQNSTIPISPNSSIVIVGFGKAVIEMARGAEDWNDVKLRSKTLLIAPKQFENTTSSGVLSSKTRIFYGAANNLPDLDSTRATEEVVREIEKSDAESTIFIFLISGGGSALLCSPRDGISLEDKQHTTKALTSKGATIQELNLIRQKLSKVKGGKLLNHIKKGRVISLIISDMIGNHLDLIASGPTVKPERNMRKEDYRAILDKLGVDAKTMLRENVVKILEEDDGPQNFEVKEKLNVSNFIVSSNDIALKSIKEDLSSLKYHSHIISSSLSGDATLIGKQLAYLIQSPADRINRLLSEILGKTDAENSVADVKFPLALIFGGETTVILKGKGKGGRNQEMVLSCLETLQKDPSSIKFSFTFLSAGSDGQDGPTDAAGAVISNYETSITSPSASEYLSHSDSYHFWSLFNNGSNHLKTGPTGTNVMDFQILLLDKLE